MTAKDAPKNLIVVNHPLVLHKLTLMRDKKTPSAVFRQLLREISLLLAYEVARDLPMTTQTIETPLAEMEAPILKGKKLAKGVRMIVTPASRAIAAIGSMSMPMTSIPAAAMGTAMRPVPTPCTVSVMSWSTLSSPAPWTFG